MTNTKTTWFNLPTNVKEVFDDLINELEIEGNTDTTFLKNVQSEITWYKLPQTLDKAVDFLKSEGYTVPVTQPTINWYMLPDTIDKLKVFIENINA